MAMRQFVHTSPALRVLFGAGTIRKLGEEAGRLGLSRVLVLSTPQQVSEAERASDALAGRAAGMFAGAAMHTPVEVTEAALRRLADLGADGIASIGGGSTVGLGKALALRTGLRHLCLPTTYAGSEMTPILGETANGLKTTQTDARIVPDTVLYDVELTMSLPPRMSLTSGLNAIAHAVEAMYARDTDPITQLMAQEGVRALYASLPGIARSGADAGARADALYGAWLCGTCLGRTSMALHHKLCHVLGGAFGLPHAETHAVVLPYALAYNAPAVPEAVHRLAQAIGRPDPASALQALNLSLGGPASLRELGMPEAGVDRALALAMDNPYWNPRPLDRGALAALLDAAWRGADLARPSGANEGGG